MERIYSLDVNRSPLYYANTEDAPLYEDLLNDEFVNLKAPIVVMMLERYMGKNFLQKVGHRGVVSSCGLCLLC